jgi:hypothetical protein
MITIRVASEFSKTPGARLIKEGGHSGEEFREKFLSPYFEDPTSNDSILIILDGAEGYPTSFLDEAFGGLARIYGKEKVLARIKYESNEDPLLIEEILQYIEHCNE